jgi:uncharacterized membrane protein YphA (DoxX/SURF4 family)
MLNWLFRPPTSGPAATVLVRLMAGGVFFSEGILKFVYANQGVGRFTKLGFPLPHLTASFVGTLEIVGGAMLMAGLLTRVIGLVFAVEMLVAISTTKVALYFGTSPLPLPPAPPQVGPWAVLHEIRTDWAQLLCSVYLAIVGPGRLSLDARLAQPATEISRGEPTALRSGR